MSLLVCRGKGEVVELVQPRELVNSLVKWFDCGICGRTKLCMVPCHSCAIYGIWGSKEVGRTL